MKAAVVTAYGDPSVLAVRDDLETPVPAPDEVLVRVRAAGVNPIDTLKRQGFGRSLFRMRRWREFPWILGSEVAGEVAEVGRRVTRLKPGDAVFAAQAAFGPGTHAAYVTLSAGDVALKPSNLSFEEAAGLPYVACTTWAALVGTGALTQRTAAGRLVLVHAGAGGIGSFAIQLLKLWGCRVATTCSPRNLDFVRSLGADQAIDYTTTDFSAVLRDVDLVYDPIGHKVAGHEERSLAVLRRPGGAYVTIAHPLLEMVDESGLPFGSVRAFATVMSQRWRHQGIRYDWSVFQPSRTVLELVRTYVEAGQIKPVIDRVYPLLKVAEAHRHVETGHARGKVVLRIDD